MTEDLRELRKRRGLTMAELSLMVRTSLPYLQRLETHTAALTDEMAARLAPHLGVPAETLAQDHAVRRERLRAELTARPGA
jgi:transcriptional regulator with XRE-family HTH domain